MRAAAHREPSQRAASGVANPSVPRGAGSAPVIYMWNCRLPFSGCGPAEQRLRWVRIAGPCKRTGEQCV